MKVLFFWIGAAMMVLGAIGLAIGVFRRKAERETMGDTYNNSGTNHGHMGPVTNNYGKQPFEMTDAVMADVRAQVGNGPVGVATHGYNPASAAMADQLCSYLVASGVDAARRPGVGMMTGLHRAVTVGRGATSPGDTSTVIYVDADK